MTITRILALLISHLLVAVIGFAAGIYMLPILMAPDPPSQSELLAVTQGATFQARFERNLQDSDFLHFGEGDVFISTEAVAFSGKLAPGPDYTVYFSPQFVQTEADFHRLKTQMVAVAKVKTFNDFLVTIPPNVSVENYNTVLIWCDAFGQFITAAQYQ